MTEAIDSPTNIEKSPYEECLQEWWDEVRQSETPPSPYECARHIFGVQPFEAKEFCWNALQSLCRWPFVPGTIPYLLKNFPEIYDPGTFGGEDDDEEEDDDDEWRLKRAFETISEFAERRYDASTEQDKLSILNFIPDSEDKMTFHLDDKQIAKYDPSLVTSTCGPSYSKEFLDVLYGRSQLSVNPKTLFGDTYRRTGMPEEYKSILTRIKGCAIQNGGIYSWCQEDMMAFLRFLLTNETKIRSLKFSCPMSICRDGKPSDGKIDPIDMLPIVDELESAGSCGVVKLNIVADSSIYDIRNGLPMLYATKKMPLLRELVVSGASELSAVLPPIQALLQRSKFRSLTLGLDLWRDDENAEIKSFFVALRQAAFLKNFEMNGRFSYSYLPSYKKNLVDICKHNTSLHHVKVRDEDCRSTDEDDNLMDYYTLLNRYGRGKMRDHSTTLPEAIELFCEILENYDGYFNEGDSKEKSTNSWLSEKIEPIYSFLHESPAITAYFATFLASVPTCDNTNTTVSPKPKRQRLA